VPGLGFATLKAILIVALLSEIFSTDRVSNSISRGLTLRTFGLSEEFGVPTTISGPTKRIPAKTKPSIPTAANTKILEFNIFAISLDVLNVEIVIIPLEAEKFMQYFQAVQKGKQIANKSQMKMFDIAGFAMLTLTTKKVDGNFLPVGEEEFTAVINSPEGFVAIITDKDGFTKTQSKAMPKEEALSIFKKLREEGMGEYPEKEIQIWSESRPTIQNEV